MSNKYLEKIAQELSEHDVRHHANRAWWKGQLGGVVGAPLPFGSMIGDGVGRAHELAQAKKKVTGHATTMSDVSGEAARSTLRSIGRSFVTGGAGGLIGAGVGAGIGALAHHHGNEVIQAGALVGGGIGAIAGGIRGSRESTRNSLRDFSHEWANEKKK